MKLVAVIVANVMLLGLTTTMLSCGAAQENNVRFHWDTDGRPIVRTPKGTLKGLKEESVNGRPFLSFYAIPYAKPPLAELRFQDPVEEEAWTEMRDASSQPEPCSQVSFKTAKAGAVTEDDVVGSEDCLYLNVFTPQVGQGEGLPVMVFLHGGGYVGGAAKEHEPHVLLDHQVVLVVPQFRLGTLAFLSTEDDVIPGNSMLKDQVAALRWVQRNIWIFGGDARRVTMFGESAGGTTSSFLALSPRARGLFSRTAWHSGSALTPFALGKFHRQVAEETATSMGLSGNLDSRSILSFLQTVSAKSLTLVAFKYYKWFVLPSVMIPRIDGDFIPEDPYKMVVKMACPPWDLMSGFTAQDGGILTHPFYFREDMRTSLKENFAEIGPLSLLMSPQNDTNRLTQATALYQYYLGEDIDIELSENYTQFMTDYTFAVPSDLMVLSHAACREPRNNTFTFKFNYRGEHSASDRYNVTIGKEWVTHLDDLIYLFPADALLEGAEPLSSPEDLAVRDIMTKLWVNFAATGNPTPDSSLGFTWEPVQRNAIKSLNLTPSPTMEADPYGKVRDFYRTVLPEHDELLRKLERRAKC